MSKKVLIIGKNSYIGNHIDEWLTKYDHQVTQLDVLTDEWKSFDYSPYDAIVHVAGSDLTGLLLCIVEKLW